jgi:hypothetical protein
MAEEAVRMVRHRRDGDQLTGQTRANGNGFVAKSSGAGEMPL